MHYVPQNTILHEIEKWYREEKINMVWAGGGKRKGTWEGTVISMSRGKGVRRGGEQHTLTFYWIHLSLNFFFSDHALLL